MDTLLNAGRSDGAAELHTPAFGTVVEVATHLRLSRPTIYTLMEKGELPYAKFGRARRIPWSAVQAYADRCMVGCSS